MRYQITQLIWFHRATTTSFHTQDLPWRFSGKLYIQEPQRASSYVSSDSWLTLPALPLSQLEFLTTLPHALGRTCFHCTEGSGPAERD